MILTEWIFSKLPTIDKDDPYYRDIIEQAKQIEKSKGFTSFQTEISDEEIENEADHYKEANGSYSFKMAIQWYREQLKKK